MDLVIAEKDMLGRDIARAMCGVEVAEDARLPIRGNGYVVCACSGHLLGLAEPAELDDALGHWSLEALPISFDPWPAVSQGSFAERRIAQIRQLLQECDGRIYHAGDADDEGQLIVDEVLEHLGFDPADERVWRVYVNGNIESAIRRAFEEARPNAGCTGAGRAARARSLADMAFGVNESRLASLSLGVKVPMGRVQTPTLGLVVERDAAREGHSERKYFGAKAIVGAQGATLPFTWKPNADVLDADGKHVFDRAIAQAAADAAAGACVELSIERSTREVEPPLPYSMTTLVSDLSKRYGYTADEVMEATQALRDEHHAITYNRSSCPYLTSGHLAEAPATTAAALANAHLDWDLDVAAGSRAFDDAKVGAHHGIIPQEVALDIDALPEQQRNAYLAIAERYLVQFAGSARIEEASASFAPDGAHGAFCYEGKALASPGWAAFAPSAWRSSIPEPCDLPAAGKSEGAVSDVEVTEGTTAPPKAYTDGTLVSAMASVARYVADEDVRAALLAKDEGIEGEHGSIGTVATRGDIIDGLIEHGYLERKGRSLVSTAKGRAFYALVPEDIKGVDMTARWWLMQQQVAAGELDETAIMDDVIASFEAHRDTAYAGKTLLPVAGKCPRCGARVVLRGKCWSCETNRREQQGDGSWADAAGCGFKVLPLSGHVLTPKEASALLQKGAVALKALKGKSGKPYDCQLALDGNESHGYAVRFPSRPARPKAAKRPKAGGKARR